MDEHLPAEAVFRKERQTMIFRIMTLLSPTLQYRSTIGPPASRLQTSGHRFSRYVQEPD
jgi:hypothetical protein